MNYRLLSYPLTMDTPKYGSKHSSLLITKDKDTSKGDSCNTHRITIENHMGTHIDCPNHFYSHGKKIYDYTNEDFIFLNTQIIKVTLGNDELLNISDIEGKINIETDFLIINSGWSELRGRDIYALNNPGVKSDVAEYLRKHYPMIRAIGVDFISISAFSNRGEGRKAHCEFLRPGGEILIIEDINLSEVTFQDYQGLSETVVIPFLKMGIDSSPCVVMQLFK